MKLQKTAAIAILLACVTAAHAEDTGDEVRKYYDILFDWSVSTEERVRRLEEQALLINSSTRGSHRIPPIYYQQPTPNFVSRPYKQPYYYDRERSRYTRYHFRYYGAAKGRIR